ncbi:hypothetical protein [Paracoccus sp. DMF]|uniref:hypothetical protein n=1 Tax=Paracoccus sp. DMF TaxID=400837 RepID=UPI001102AEC6|nr:hypothetical protein [Paracoccus sp. DMF]MCV2447293.1 hypothetical protein [Paracoccus sp. DMF]
MRLRSEATGGYDFGWLIVLGLALLASSVAGLVLLAVAGWRHFSGRPSPRLLIGGLVLALPLLAVLLALMG